MIIVFWERKAWSVAAEFGSAANKTESPRFTRAFFWTFMIEYLINEKLQAEEVALIFESSGINRPTKDLSRIQNMLDHANLIVTARLDNQLIGIARSLTDFSYCCYLSDLAVQKEFQKQNIGRKLIEVTRDQIGDKSMLLLLSAPDAMGYYLKVGFEKVENGWIIKRQC